MVAWGCDMSTVFCQQVTKYLQVIFFIDFFQSGGKNLMGDAFPPEFYPYAVSASRGKHDFIMNRRSAAAFFVHKTFFFPLSENAVNRLIAHSFFSHFDCQVR